MNTIYLVRHGAVPRRYRLRFIGRTNVPLSQEGRRQARRLATLFLHRPELVVLCSPMRRARATARLAVPHHNGKSQIIRDLREMDFGGWEGLTFEQIRRLDPSGVDQWANFSGTFRFPGGERLRSFQARLRRVARGLLRHRAPELLVVSHGGVIRSLLCLWKGIPLCRYPEINVPPGSVSIVRVQNGKPRIISMGTSG